MSKLYDGENTKTYVVTSAPPISLLNSLGVFAGSKVTKKATYSMGGPVLVEIEGRDVAIGKDFAVDIEVDLLEGAAV